MSCFAIFQPGPLRILCLYRLGYYVSFRRAWLKIHNDCLFPVARGSLQPTALAPSLVWLEIHTGPEYTTIVCLLPQFARYSRLHLLLRLIPTDTHSQLLQGLRDTGACFFRDQAPTTRAFQRLLAPGLLPRPPEDDGLSVALPVLLSIHPFHRTLAARLETRRHRRALFLLRGPHPRRTTRGFRTPARAFLGQGSATRAFFRGF